MNVLGVKNISQSQTNLSWGSAISHFVTQDNSMYCVSTPRPSWVHFVKCLVVHLALASAKKRPKYRAGWSIVVRL